VPLQTTKRGFLPTVAAHGYAAAGELPRLNVTEAATIAARSWDDPSSHRRQVQPR